MPDIKVPVFSESISEGTLLSWHKQPGESVRRGDILAEIETDKVVLEVTALQDGTLLSAGANEGDTVLSEQVIGVIGEAGATTGTSIPAATDPAAGPVAGESSAAGTASQPDSSPQSAQAQSAQTQPAQVQPAPAVSGAAPALSPAVRKVVAEHGLDPAQLPASGPRGNVTKQDAVGAAQAVAERVVVEQGGATYQGPQSEAEPASMREAEGRESGGQTTSPTPAPQAAPQPTPLQTRAPAPAAPAPLPGGPRPEQRVPMTRIRQRIAERLKEVQNTAALLTTFNEVNMQPSMDLRRKYQDLFVARHGVKLGFMSLFVRAATEALKAFPVVNASVDGKDVIYHGYYDVGIAVASERGLVVPILRDTDALGLADIEKAVAGFAGKAKSGKLTLEDMSGGTFSITNGGTFGSMMSTPIINAPQSAILGMHNIIERPVAENGQVVIRPMMYVALSYDHRIIDGKEAVQFLVTVKNLLEDPARMLLDL